LFIQGSVLGNDTDKNNNNPIEYNIVVVVINALRADHLPSYGYSRDTSPHIDRLAQDGIIFDRAIAQSYWTLPSIVSIFTSKYMCAHNVDSRDKKLGEDTSTLAEVLSSHGYTTAAFTCGLDTAAIYGIDRGFDIYSVYGGNEATGSFSDIMPKAMKWLNKNKNKKFFLFLHSYDVHMPYKDYPGDGFDKDYKGIFNDLPLDYNELKKINNYTLYSENRKIQLSVEDINHIIASYDDCIRYADGFIGHLIDNLKRLKLYDKTIIILCADHGEELGERGTFNRFGNQNLYQEVIRVPLIIKHPSIRLNGQRIKSAVELVDIMPTILDLLGISMPGDLQGKSLASLIKNGVDRVVHEYVFSEASKHKWMILRHDGWKLLYALERGELYNINDDPSERNNLNEQNLSIQVSLMKEFFLWREHNRRERIDNHVKLDTQLLDKLKKAGYW
jgi:arylsulfatase A-like enzyme